MKIDFLISTMFRENLLFLDQMNLENSSKVIINQITEKQGKDILIDKSNIKVRSFIERGLSKSRNRAIEISEADICVVADDDIVYVKNIEEIIKEGYLSYPDSDIIIFDYETDLKERSCKKIGKAGKKLNYNDILKVSSVRITFRRNSILKNQIKFDERFGAGAAFFSGEENLFLKSCLDNNLVIRYIPRTICKVDFSESSWFSGYNVAWFIAKGAFARAFFNKWQAHLYMFYFILSKYRLYRKNASMLTAYRNLYKGFFKIRAF